MALSIPDWNQPVFRYISLAVAGLLFVLLLIYVDVVFRARNAFLEGEKYMSWVQNPSLKQSAIGAWYEREKKNLEERKRKNKLTESEYQSQLESLEFDRQTQLNESSLKYAYQWYKDTYELFSPPESRWVKQARIKSREALELWKKELREKNIPFDETMVQ